MDSLDKQYSVASRHTDNRTKLMARNFLTIYKINMFYKKKQELLACLKYFTSLNNTKMKIIEIGSVKQVTLSKG